MGGLAPGSVGPLQLSSNVPLVTGGHQLIAVPASETRNNTTYGVMPTPDQVTNIVMGTSGIIRVWYQALWAEAVSGAARAAIFIGPTQLQVAVPGSIPANSECGTLASSTTGIYGVLATTNLGIGSTSTQGVGTTLADVTTGQVFGASTAPNLTVGGVAANSVWGACSIFAAPGTYTVSVQFRSTSGLVYVSNRRLYVQVTPL